ncbi:MAG: hypothetical protein ACRENU_09325 [Gemmatimonadaceae bacterium]
MSTAARRARPIILTLSVLGMIGCSWGYGQDPYYSYNYDYDYPWYYNTYGTYAVVRRPVVEVDGWTTRTFRNRPYRGYNVRRHNSSPITYSATRKDETLEVNLTGMDDSTRVEIKARKGDDKWDKERAKALMGEILKDYKK